MAIKITISINNEIVKDAKINRERKYFSKGLSSIYSKLGLVTKDNVIKIEYLSTVLM